MKHPAATLGIPIEWFDVKRVFQYQKNIHDAYLVNVHGDMAELLHVDPANGCSRYTMLSAPIAVIRKSVKSLIDNKGYKKCESIDLSLRGLVNN